ncbi:MAG: hypothetical protein IPK13_18430 [Deltaproteobacteria bacterium]|nr:hypothetical protein [Deltaproteobacteria bacterium]
MTGLHLDFVVYPDPDDAASGIVSGAMLKGQGARPKLTFPDVYGAVTVSRAGKEIAERKPDPVLPLVTNFVRAVPYLIDGETETVLLSESANGFLFEPSGDDIFFSFFSGDAYEPEEYYIEHTSIPIAEFGEQVLAMGERLRDIIKVADPEFFERDEYSKTLVEFIDLGRKAFKTFKLEVERGLRIPL